MHHRGNLAKIWLNEHKMMAALAEPHPRLRPPVASMEVTQLTERPALEPFLCANPDVHVYAIGDLDPSCWDDCTWHGLREGGELRAVALTYRGLATPVVQVLAEPGEPYRNKMVGFV